MTRELRSVPNVTRQPCACPSCAGRDGGVRDGGVRDGGLARQKHSGFSTVEDLCTLREKMPICECV